MNLLGVAAVPLPYQREAEVCVATHQNHPAAKNKKMTPNSKR